MNKHSFFWFVLGLGVQLQVVFSLSITEVVVLLYTPFILASELPQMRRTGVLTFFNMAVLLVIGCIVSLIVNHAEFYRALRGLSVTGLILCSVVVAHRMIRTHPAGLKWFFIGAMMSTILCTFVFQRSVEVASVGGEDLDSIMSGPLFWIGRVKEVLSMPSTAFYLKMPLLYSSGVQIFLAVFSMMISASGRSAALGALGCAAMVIIGRKKRKSIATIGRHFAILLSLAVIGIFAAKTVYQWAALNNYLGEKARAKYEHQSSGGNSIVKLLIGGRADSFVGLLAIADSPIFGKGYWAPDTNGYDEEFLAKYGNLDDFEQYLKTRMHYAEMGIDVRSQKMISCHSYITSFWLWYGLPGLLFWIYVVYVVFRYLRQDAPAVPQWFFWLAAGVPSFLWALCFSPFNMRFPLPLWVVGMLIARAVRLGKCHLPFEMIREIEENERK